MIALIAQIRISWTTILLVLILRPSAISQELVAPVDWQVIQRNSDNHAQIEISGTVSKDATIVEARVALVDGTPESVTDWKVIATDDSFREGKFQSSLRVAAGGWYSLQVRSRRSADDPTIVDEAKVDHVGVGEIFVIAGQSNSSNHGSERQNTTTKLVAAFDGMRWQLANDPQPGGSGDAGSFMPPFGDAVARELKVPVGIVACGIGATSVREWLPEHETFTAPPTLEGRVRKLASGRWESNGDAFRMLTQRMKSLGPNGFRAVLWHQGESDAEQPDPKRSLPGSLYREYLEKLITLSRREIGWDAPWFVALVSSHGADGVPEIRAAQRSLWTDGIAQEGPDSDALRGDLRDGVHFTGPGLRLHGLRWAEKVIPWIETQVGVRE